MAEKHKSKKQVARDYFSSLDTSLPLRKRVDELVEFMKIHFVNSQSERVVFNYIRDDLNKEELPSLEGDIFRNIIKYKIDQKNTEWSPLSFEAEDPAGRALAVLMAVDLYSEKVKHHIDSDYYFSNKINVNFKNNLINIESHESENNGWISKFSSGDDLIRNHFPFHSKSQLESPVTIEDIIDISRDYLGNDSIEILNNVMSSGRNYKSAADYLEFDYSWDLESKSKRDTESTGLEASVPKKPFILFRIAQWLVAAFFGFFAVIALLSLEKLSIPGVPILLFWASLASLVGIVIAHSPPIFFRFPFKGKVGVYAGSLAAFFMFGIWIVQMQAAYDKTPEGIAEAQKKIDAAEATAAASSGTDTDENLGSYSRSSSFTRDSMTNETRERINNLNPEGQAYVYEQLQKADEFCARNPDFESCW